MRFLRPSGGGAGVGCSLARVIAVEKPMQIFGALTSLSISGMAMTVIPAAERRRKAQRVVAPMLRPPTPSGQDFQARWGEVGLLHRTDLFERDRDGPILGSLDSDILRVFVREVFRTVPPCVDRAGILAIQRLI